MSKTRLAHLAPFAAEPVVFFTVVTKDRMAILANEHAHDVLCQIWERSSRVNGWWVGDYVLMPDHVHFFARAGRSSDAMTRWVKMWKSTSARAIGTTHHIQGSIWQEDYFDRYLRSDENYSEKWSYVESNPVRAGLVSRVEDWPYRGRIHDLKY